LEATVFALDFSNQIIAPSLSAGSVAQAQLANQGETLHRGTEGAIAVDIGMLVGWPVSVTTEARHTYVHSVFSADRYMTGQSGDTVNVKGNRLPYAPEHNVTLALRIQHPSGASFRVDGTRIGSQFTDNFMTVEPLPNGRTGLIDAYTLVNLAGSYDFAGVTVFGTVKNLFDERYIASRRPQGIKAGLPRMLQIGVRTHF
jgi:Fe(3+) dicitrate transport protein